MLMNYIFKLYKKFFNSEIKLSSKESKILRACELILSRNDQKISVIPGETDYLIQSKNLAYYLHVSNDVITFSNHGHTVTKNYRLKFVELIKEKIKQKTIIDRNNMLTDMSHNEEVLLDKMIENLLSGLEINTK